MRHDAGGNAGGSTDFVQVEAQLADQGSLAVGTGQQVAIGREGVERAEEAQALNELTDERVYRDHTFRLQLSEGNVNGPTVGSNVTKAFPGEIDTFTDAHTGVAQQQEDVSRQIVAME